MTMVVTDVSRHGIVVVGDSAVTRKTDAGDRTATAGAVKVHYAQPANIGFALWGNAGVSGKRMDWWMDDFCSRQIHQGDSVEDVAARLVDALNQELKQCGQPWKELVRGIHVSGYRDGLPVLFHIHTGHDNEPAHELRLYKDFPDDQQWSEGHYQALLNYGFIHLRNGYHPLFGPLFEKAMEYAAHLRASYNITFPQNSLNGRLEFYKLLVRFVAGTLVSAGLHPGVNDQLCCVAFDVAGLKVDERLAVASVPASPSRHCDETFSTEPPRAPYRTVSRAKGHAPP